jgi:hypothetical protein
MTSRELFGQGNQPESTGTGGAIKSNVPTPAITEFHGAQGA